MYIFGTSHKGVLIGITQGMQGYRYQLVFEVGSSSSDCTYPVLDEALKAAIADAESHVQYDSGFLAHDRGEPLPQNAPLPFVRGWKEAKVMQDEDLAA